MRPLLEYASVVWDGCADYEKDKLERLQYEAARIVTGLTRSVSINELIKEIGWLSLQERRNLQKLTIMYKIENGMLPDQFSNIFPNRVGENSDYNLRNASNFEVVNRRTSLFSNSFVPSAVNQWNNLPVHIKNSNSVSVFKSNLIKECFHHHKVPAYFISGSRTFSVYHARLRNNCSDLNADLFYNHLKNDKRCQCGYETENAEHYLLKCTLFSEQRLRLFRSTSEFLPLSLQTLLFGNEQLSCDENARIFEAVQTFIKETKRFSRD